MSIAGADEPDTDDKSNNVRPQSTPAIVDALGKPIELSEDQDELVELPELAIKAESYEADVEFGDIYRYLTTGEMTGCDTRDRKTLLMSDLFFIENGLLYYIEHTRSKKLRRLKQVRPRLCIPRTHQSYVLDYFHTFLNHATVERLYKSASDTIYFHKLYEACHMLVNTCEICILGRAKYPVSNPLNQHQIQTAFGRSWHVDFLNLNRVTPSGYKYVLVCVESSCGYIEARLAKTLTSSETARLLIEAIVVNHGMMSTLYSDRGSNFCSKVIAKMSAIIGCKHKMSSSGNSRSNGRAEVAIRGVRHALQISCKNDLLIEDQLPLVQLGLNVSWSSTIGTSPWFCRNLRDFPILGGLSGTPEELGETDPNITAADRQYLSSLYRATEQIRKNVALNLAESRAKQAKCFNKHFRTKDSTFKVGDHVVIHSKGPKAGSNRVLTHPKNVGWFRVTQIYDKAKEGEGPAYRLISLITGRMLRNPIAGHRLHKVNADRTEFLNKFPPLPGWQKDTSTCIPESPERDQDTQMVTDPPKTNNNHQPDGYLGKGYYQKHGPQWLVEWLDGTSSWLATKDVSYPLRAAWFERQRNVVTPRPKLRRGHMN